MNSTLKFPGTQLRMGAVGRTGERSGGTGSHPAGPPRAAEGEDLRVIYQRDLEFRRISLGTRVNAVPRMTQLLGRLEAMGIDPLDPPTDLGQRLVKEMLNEGLSDGSARSLCGALNSLYRALEDSEYPGFQARGHRLKVEEVLRELRRAN